MKQSVYNSLLPLTEKYYLLYNALTDRSIIVPEKHREVLVNNDWASIEPLYPQFYEQLVSAGCLVNDDFDEGKELQNQMDRVKNNSSEYHLIVNPTVNCNFKCWYCYESHLSDSKMDEQTLQQVCNHIDWVLQDTAIKCFRLSFFGGEPLLYYKEVVKPIIRHLLASCRRKEVIPHIYFTSNGYLLNEELIRELAGYSVDSFQITLDGNREHHNRVRFPHKGKDSYERIIANVKSLVNQHIFVILRINYTQDNVTSLQDILPDFNDLSEADKKYLSVDFQKVWQDDVSKVENAEEYIEKAIQVFRKSHFVVTHKIFDMIRNPCYADKKNEHLINYEGSVYKCTARDFTKKNRLGYLQEDGSLFLESPVSYVYSLPEKCLACRIAPLCGGGCFQRRNEPHSADCVYDYNENMKDRIVWNRFCDLQVK